MNGKTLVIVNPCSGKAKMRTELLGVVEILSGDGSLVTVYPTKERGDATRFAASLKENEYDKIVVCGGDGTLNEVITGLMTADIIRLDIYPPARLTSGQAVCAFQEA